MAMSAPYRGGPEEPRGTYPAVLTDIVGLFRAAVCDSDKFWMKVHGTGCMFRGVSPAGTGRDRPASGPYTADADPVREALLGEIPGTQCHRRASVHRALPARGGAGPQV